MNIMLASTYMTFFLIPFLFFSHVFHLTNPLTFSFFTTTDAYRAAAQGLKAGRKEANLTAESAAEAMDAFQEEVRILVVVFMHILLSANLNLFHNF